MDEARRVASTTPASWWVSSNTIQRGWRNGNKDCAKLPDCVLRRPTLIFPPAIMLIGETMKFAAKGLIVIGWIYILLIIVIMSADIGGWSKVFNLSHSWSDTVVVTLTMLPGMGLVLLGDKLREIAARNELAEKLREMWGLPR